MDILYKIFFMLIVVLLGFLSVLAIDDQCHDFTGKGGRIVQAVEEYVEI